MTVLWLLRHGEAARPSGVSDAERPLTARGAAQARESGRTLAEHAPRLEVVLSSPKVRALETARLACEAHGGDDEPVTIEELGGDYTMQELLALISPWSGRPGEAPRPGHLLVVGHNPELTNVASQLVGESLGMPTGALIAIDLQSRTLLHSLVPDS